MFKAQYLLYSIALGLIVLGTFPIILPTHITLGITVFVLLLTTSELIESVLEYKEPTEDDITLGERINNNALELFYFLSQMLMYASVPLAIFFSYYTNKNFTEGHMQYSGQSLTLIALSFTILIIAQFKNQK